MIAAALVEIGSNPLIVVPVAVIVLLIAILAQAAKERSGEPVKLPTHA